jgi:predicted MPP superfamily phosphohydrolase
MDLAGLRGLRLSSVDIRGRRGTQELISILHLSDLHGKSFRSSRPSLGQLLGDLEPDLVVLTGDLLDERSRTTDGVKDLLAILPPAPAFFVPGNHDPACPLYPALLNLLAIRGVQPLVNEAAVFTKGDIRIRIVGLDDPLRGAPDLSLLEAPEDRPPHPGAAEFAATLVAAHSPTLGRRNARRAGVKPALLPLAARCGVDLVLCGHTHGGQVKLPWIGALFIPGQRLFPRYVRGVYSMGGTSMHVTAGLGTSHLPVRFMCPPEVAFIHWRP